MGRERAAWPIVIVVAIVASALLTRALPPPSASSPPSAFRTLFWNDRGLDVLIQAALILVGALGIAALLPRGSEDE